MENTVGYNPSFAEEVFQNVHSGDEIKMCMNCGVCAASCPLREHMDYPPRQIFSLIRAGKRELVLGSEAIMLCTSCYTCAVKCPRSIPVIDVMHGLAHYALTKGYMPRVETARFGKEFWNQVYRIGRVDEKDLPRRVFFAGGFVEGIKAMLKFMDIGIKLLLHHRMKLLPERKIKGIKSLKKMLDKAEMLEKGGGGTMKYFLYWGCSLEGSGANFLVSLKPPCEALGIEFLEIEDWNCCGASVSYAGAGDLAIKVLNARNLAIAEAEGGYDVVAPCSSCYIQMIKVNHEIKENPKLLDEVNACLSEGGLKYNGNLNVRHLQDVLYNDIGVDKIKEKVVKPLNGLKVAGYVGCQSVRPYGEYDSVNKPVVQDRLIEALGAEAVPFPNKIKCCGSGIFLPEIDYCMELVKNILEDALNHGADVISTICPMCAMNLELYQGRINDKYGTDFDVPILYLTQLMAIAFGMDMKKDAALNYNVIPPEGVIRAAIG